MTSTEYEKATDYSFKEEDIERANALVGRYSPTRSQEHLTTATPDAMRNFARGYGDDNPLYGDEDYGRDDPLGRADRPADDPHRPEPTAVRRQADASKLKRPSFRGIHVFVSGSTWQWYRPIVAGDQLYSFGGIESVDREGVGVRRALGPDHPRQREDEPAGRDRRHLPHPRHPHRAQDGAGRRASTPRSSRRPTPTSSSPSSTPSTPPSRPAAPRLAGGRTSRSATRCSRWPRAR